MKRALIICFAVFLLMQFIRPQKVEYSEDETYEIVLPSDKHDTPHFHQFGELSAERRFLIHGY